MFCQDAQPPVAEARKMYKANKVQHAQTDWFLETKKEQPNVAFAEARYKAYFAEHPNEFSKIRVIFEHWLKDAKAYSNEGGLFEKPRFEYNYEPPRNGGIQLRNALNPDWTALGVINLDKEKCGNHANLTGGFCDRVYINPYNTQNLFAGMSFGGLWVSKDQGTTWALTDAEYPNGTNTYANQDYYYGEIEASKANSNLVFAATEAGLLKSNNGGSNWSLSPQLNRSVSANERPYYVAASPNNASIVLSTFGKKIYRSTDGGNTWSVVFDNSGGGATHRFNSGFGSNIPFQIDERTYNFFGLEASLVNSGEYFLGVWNSSNQACIYKSTDNGATFSLLVNLNTTLSTAWNAATVLHLKTLANNNNFFVYEGFVEKKSKYKFSPTGSLVSSTPINGFVEGFTMDWNNENTMYQGEYSKNFITKSTNNGSSFANPNSGCNFLWYDTRDISAVGNLVLIGSDACLTLSKDGGTTTIGTGFEINSMDMWGFSSSSKSDICLTGVDHNASFYRNKNGKWFTIKGADAGFSSVHPADDHWLYYDWGYGENRGFLSDDGKLTEYGVAPSLSMEKLAFHPNNLNEIYAVTKAGNILMRSTDNLATATTLYDFGETINQIRLSRTDGKVMYCLLSNNKIKKTTDGGATWTLVTPPSSVTGSQTKINSIDVGKDSDELWAAYGGNQNTCKVVYSSNGGATWTNITSANLPAYSVSNVDYQRGTNGGAYISIITASGVTIWYKNKTMSQWEKLGTSSIQMGYITNRLFPVPAKGKLRFGSSRGAYEHNLYENSGIEIGMASSTRTVDCALSPVQFRDASAYPSGAVSFLWTFPGGSPATSTLENPSVKYATAGKYNVTLKVTLENGQTQEKTWTEFIEKLNTDVCGNIVGAGKSLKTQNGSVVLHTLPLNSSTFSISMWAKPEGLQKSFSQLLSLTGTEYFGIGFSFSGYTANNNLVISTKATNTDYGINSPITLPANAWSHITVNYSPSKIQFFINGKMSWELTGTFPAINFTTQPLSINGDPHNQSGDYKGEIDELLIYNRLLTQDEIREKMHLSRSPANEQGLVAYYAFDEYSPSGQALFSTFGNSEGLPVAPANIVTSTTPIGKGKSVLISNLSANTIYSFPASNMSVKTGTTQTGSQIVATRLFAQPDQLPQVNNVTLAQNYWIVRSWNSAGDAANANVSLVLDNTPISSNSTAASVNLFRRTPNDFGNTWGNSILAAQSMTTGTTGSATFTSTTALQSDGQYIYSYTTPTVSLPVITTQPTNKTVCSGNSASFTVVATGDSLKYQWQWSGDNGTTWGNAGEPGATTATITVTNDAVIFRVIVRNNGGSVTSNTVKLTVNATPTANITGNLSVCSGQTTALTATGGGTYTWSNNATTPSVTVGAGTYTVTVTGTGGCSATKSVTVVANGITANITGNLSICTGQTTALTATGGGTYAWSNNATTPSVNIGAGTYTVTVTGTGGCSATKSVTVVANGITANITGNLSICTGQTTALTASGGSTYKWNNGATTPSVTVGAGTYTVTVTGTGGCSATKSVTVVANGITANITGNLSICTGQTTTLTATGGGTYAWSNNATTPSVTVGAGTYTVTVTGTGGCSATKSVTVVANGITANITGNLSICTGQTTALTATGGGTYAWSNNATTAAITVGAGTYTVTVTGTGGCSATKSVTVVANGITANITGNLSICTGQTTALTATGGSTYKWNNGATTPSVTVGVGTYTVTVTGTSGCSAIQTVTVTAQTNNITVSNCPSNIKVSAWFSCQKVTWTAPTFSSNCGTPSVSSNYNSGYCFPRGTTTVTYTASLNGVVKTCSFTVTITYPFAFSNTQNTLLDLSARSELHSVQLVWVNNTGDKNDYFEVEKQNETSGNFDKIAVINSKNGDKTEYYTAYDATPNEGDNIYRINLIATDSSKKISNTSTVKFFKTLDFRIFPNPTLDYIDVDLKQYEGKAVTLQVYNSFGKLITTRQVDKATSAPVHIEIGAQASGKYLLRVTAQGRRDAVKKFVIQQ